MKRLARDKRHRIVRLRRNGKSIPEISRETGIARTTIQRYVRGVDVLPQFQAALREKQGGSKKRAQELRSNIKEKITNDLRNISKRDYLFLLIGLYWGEGTKRDFSLINSDPRLLQAFIICLARIGIQKERLALSLRVHHDISVRRARHFWSKATGLSETKITRVEIVEGKKKGKLTYGMCRVRVRAGIRERLLIQSAIALIGEECMKKLVS